MRPAAGEGDRCETTPTAECPTWCSLSHDDEPTSHQSRSVIIPVGHGDTTEEFLEIRTVQYTADIAGTSDLTPEMMPFVEVAHHASGRYRLINLACSQVEALADALLHCSEAAIHALR
jgi:hypothetical protein